MLNSVFFPSISGCCLWCPMQFWRIRSFVKTPPFSPGGHWGIGPGWLGRTRRGGGGPESLLHGCAWLFSHCNPQTQTSFQVFLTSSSCRKRQNQVLLHKLIISSSVRSLIFHLMPRHWEMSRRCCCAFLSPIIVFSENRLHGPPLGLRLYMLLLGGTMCVSVVRLLFTVLQPMVLLLSPAIWHCLTKDTNIPNWIQPFCELF